MLDVQKNVDDDRIEMLERMIREASDTVMESERKYEEVHLLLVLWSRNLKFFCYSICFIVWHLQFGGKTVLISQKNTKVCCNTHVGSSYKLLS